MFCVLFKRLHVQCLRCVDHSPVVAEFTPLYVYGPSNIHCITVVDPINSTTKIHVLVHIVLLLFLFWPVLQIPHTRLNFEKLKTTKSRLSVHAKCALVCGVCTKSSWKVLLQAFHFCQIFIPTYGTP